LAADDRIRNLTDGLARIGFSAALAARLVEEEAAKARLQSEADALRADQAPRVLPHPKVIEGILTNLIHLLDADPGRARAILKRFMPPVVLMPEGDGWRLTGGFDLEATLDEKSAVREVGGTGIEPAARAV
jgi:hypothetical protein